MRYRKAFSFRGGLLREAKREYAGAVQASAILSEALGTQLLCEGEFYYAP